jgi:hypothetical protein
MGRDCGGKLSFDLPQIAALPQIANPSTQVGRIAEIFPRHRDFLLGGAAIEKNHRPASILQWPGPDFQFTFLAHPPPFNSQGILIHRKHFFIGQNLPDLRSHIAQIIARHQRSREDGPQAEVGLVFGSRHAAISDLKHVRIIPVPGAGKTLQPLLQI